MHDFYFISGTHASLGHVNDENGCQCAKYACSCCIHLEVPKIGLNDTGELYFVFTHNIYFGPLIEAKFR